jgi:hypothetical protein
MGKEKEKGEKRKEKKEKDMRNESIYIIRRK